VTSSGEIRQRSDARLQGLYDSIANDQPVDWAKQNLLNVVEIVQHGNSQTDEAIERNRQADAEFERIRQSI
jgi:hypothetical protein